MSGRGDGGSGDPIQGFPLLEQILETSVGLLFMDDSWMINGTCHSGVGRGLRTSFLFVHSFNRRYRWSSKETLMSSGSRRSLLFYEV